MFVPIEILLHIASSDHLAWKAMLAIPDFAAWTLSSAARAFVLHRFCETAYDGTKFRGEYHSFFGLHSRKIIKEEYDILCWTKNGKLHRDGGPALIVVRGEDKTEEWYCCGALHREGGPAFVRTSRDKITREKWCRRGLVHREDGPAEMGIRYYGVVEIWRTNGVKNRIDGGPTKITTYHTDNVSIKHEYHRDGKLHRDDGPAVVEFFRSGKTRHESWYNRASKHRDGGPAVLMWNEKGAKIYEQWCENGYQHRDGDPAIFFWYDNGNKEKEVWLLYDKNCRTDIHLPAETNFYPDGRKKQETWRNSNGKKDRRDDKPAIVKYEKNGDIAEEIWYEESKKHRGDDKPAVVFYENGRIISCEWYTGGVLQRKSGPISVLSEEEIEKEYPNGLRKMYDKDLYFTQKARFVVFGVETQF